MDEVFVLYCAAVQYTTYVDPHRVNEWRIVLQLRVELRLWLYSPRGGAAVASVIAISAGVRPTPYTHYRRGAANSPI